MNYQMKQNTRERGKVGGHMHTHTHALKRGERNCVFFRGKCLLLLSILNSRTQVVFY